MKPIKKEKIEALRQQVEQDRERIREDIWRVVLEHGMEKSSSNDCKAEELTPPRPPLERSCSSSSKPEVPLGPSADTEGTVGFIIMTTVFSKPSYIMSTFSWSYSPWPELELHYYY